ncbi:MAG: glutamine amidotransferase [Mycobacteriales bacterium]
MRGSALVIAELYPDLLGTYGDGGNVRVLQRRLEWRGIAVEVATVNGADCVPEQADLYVLGGGEDLAQLHALALLRGSALAAAVDHGRPVFAVCAGLQLLGRTLSVGLQETTGLGLVDAESYRLAHRAVGEVLCRAHDPELGLVNGFVNHGSGTRLGPAARPFATAVHGPANEGDDLGPEGLVQGSVVGTYLHGPVLARNPLLADWLLTRAVGSPLAPLPPGAGEALAAARTASFNRR